MQIHLIRHAHAGSRSAWDKADHKRPLSPRGQDQAQAIADALADAGIEELWTSPSLRCRQTLVPLAEATGLEVQVVEVLNEGNDGPPTLDALLAAAAEGRVVAACSHGDVIPAVVATATRRGADLEGPRAIGKAGRYVCTVEDGQIRHIQAFPPPDGEG
ncbi:MAG TPA: phosphoglycerate mutase family protein [Acidimicrobiales bacterium]|nr:phosphoglycerate mutase family protein [Acidimicrobiales bacterium]